MKSDSLIKSTTLFSAATLISRVTGLVRESCIAAFIPAYWQDVFWAGFKIPNTFRNLFAEGSLSAAFIPLLAKVREKEGESAARETGFAVFSFLSVYLGILILVGILLAPWYVPFILEFSDEQKVKDSVTVTQIMFPFLYFIAWAAWTMGVLNARRYFFVPALASAFSNISIIAGAALGPIFFTDMPLMWFMGGAVIIGGLFQFGAQLFQAREIGFFPIRWTNPLHPRVKELLRMLAPSVFGLAIYQINALVTQTYFASKFEGGISITTYAFRLLQFPLGVVGVALATASFPRIAEFYAQGRREDASRTLMDVLKYLLLLMIPAAAGFIVLGRDIIGIIFDYREFKEAGWLEPTTLVLHFYSLGLIAYSSAMVLARTSQAFHDFKTPVKSGFCGVVTNIILCVLFVNSGMPLWSLSLAATIASSINALIMFIILYPRLTGFRLRIVLEYALRVLIATAGMAAVCYAVTVLLPTPNGRFYLYALRVAVGMACSLLTYAALGWLLFQKELRSVMRLR